MNITWGNRFLSAFCGKFLLAMAALLAVTACAANVRTQGTSSLPSFTQYPAPPLYEGRAASLVLSDETRAFRSRLQEAAKQPVNFAGEYVLTLWGCGAGCVDGAVVSRKTGKVSMLPSALHVREEGGHALQYRVDSRLLVMNGSFTEGGISSRHCYTINGDIFVPVKAFGLR